MTQGVLPLPRPSGAAGTVRYAPYAPSSPAGPYAPPGPPAAWPAAAPAPGRALDLVSVAELVLEEREVAGHALEVARPARALRPPQPLAGTSTRAAPRPRNARLMQGEKKRCVRLGMMMH